jgi:riboflavin transporter FmnP
MNQRKSLRGYTRPMAVVAIMAALSIVLMMLEFSVPIVPSFLKFDISDFPALLTSFAVSPIAGVAVCFLKNVLHLFFTTTSGVGELANFIMGVSFVLPASLFYYRNKTLKRALIGMAVGTASLVLVGALCNYFLMIPAYVYLAGFPMDAVIGMGSAVNPAIQDLTSLILIAVVPFNLIKGALCSVLTALLYKRVSPILHI